MRADPAVLPFEPSRAPRAYKLPLFPASWYLFADARAITQRPLVRTMFGRELVAFRTRAAVPVILDARCSHAGASLGHGRVIGDAIQCPFHGWRYGPDGACVAIPSRCAIPEFARQQSYAVEERHGSTFVFNGAQPSFPLPWFDDVEPEAVVAGRPFEFTAQTPWPSVTGHAFDLQHFQHVHDRRLLEPPVIDMPAPYVRRIRYVAEVVPRNWRDRVLSGMAGRTVSTSLVVHGGTFTVITARFNNAVSRFIMTMLPIGRRETLCQGIVFGDRSLRMLLPIRRYFTRAYLADENQILGRASYDPEHFVEADRPLADYFEFLEGISEPGELL